MPANSTLSYCRVRWHRRRSVDDQCAATTPMTNSFHYSIPEPIPSTTLVDMIRFYAHPEMRAEFDLDDELLQQTIFEVRQMLAVWTPTTLWHRELVMHGRHLQWLIWQVANSQCDPMVETYTDLDQVIEPWVINIDTLLDYRLILPAPQYRPSVED